MAGRRLERAGENGRSNPQPQPVSVEAPRDGEAERLEADNAGVGEADLAAVGKVLDSQPGADRPPAASFEAHAGVGDELEVPPSPTDEQRAVELGQAKSALPIEPRAEALPP